jgi:hypothetical protein
VIALEVHDAVAQAAGQTELRAQVRFNRVRELWQRSGQQADLLRSLEAGTRVIALPIVAEKLEHFGARLVRKQEPAVAAELLAQQV